MISIGRVVVATSFACAFLFAIACSTFRETPVTAGDGGADGGTSEPSTFEIVHEDADAGALRAIWGQAATNQIVTAGDDGVLFEWNTDHWAEVDMGVGVDLSGVWGSGPKDILVVGTTKNTNEGPIFHKGTDLRWIQIGTAPHGLKSIWGIGNDRFAGANDGVIYSGTYIQPLANAVQIEPNPTIPKSNFSPIGYSVGGNSATSVMVAEDIDFTAYYDGAQWHTFADSIDRTRSFRAIWGPPGPAINLFEGANYYGLWQFTGQDNPVIQVHEEKDAPQKFNRYIWGIWGSDADHIVCVGDGGRIMTYDTATQRVRVRPSPTGKNLYGVWGTSLDDVWIVGEDQLILHGALPF